MHNRKTIKRRKEEGEEINLIIIKNNTYTLYIIILYYNFKIVHIYYILCEFTSKNVFYQINKLKLYFFHLKSYPVII